MGTLKGKERVGVREVEEVKRGMKGDGDNERKGKVALG